jgi:tellurite methyltransferase
MEQEANRPQEFWDRLWSNDEEHDFWKQVAPEIVELIQSQSPEERPDVLDLGCGLGRNAMAFAEAGFRVTATDLSPKAIAHLEKWAGKSGFEMRTRIGDFTEDVFPAESFDIVISVNVLYHGYREQCMQAFRNVREWLRPDGIFYFTFPTREDGETDTELAPNTYQVDPGHMHYCADEEDLEAFLEGFHVLRRGRKDHHWEDHGVPKFSSRWQVLAEKTRDEGGEV